MKKRFSRQVVDFVLKDTKHWQEFGITCASDLENENVIITKDETKILCFIARRLRDGKFARGCFSIDEGNASFAVSDLSEKEVEFINKMIELGGAKWTKLIF